MATKCAIITLLAIIPNSVFARNASGPIVDLGYAKYRGSYNSTLDVNDFWGLPFATPPVGQLRWRAPQPYLPLINISSTILDATEPGNICVQGFPVWADPNPGIPPGSENCLVLNVIQPANAVKDAKLPVLVAIHGGGYTVGDSITTQPYSLIYHAKNTFIGVSVQYRLGAYGFMGSKEFIKEGGTPNIGLLDQRLALEWIQKNIAAFGGDPEKVTIQGGSAGGGSVTSQMTMYGGVEDPPFRAAAAQFPWWQQYLKQDQLSAQFKYLLSAANCTDLACLRRLPEDVLKAATQATYTNGYAEGAYGYGNFYYGPYVDGKIIQDLPSNEFKAGRFAKVPMLVDREGYEGWAFTNQSLSTREEQTTDLKIQFPYAYPGFINDLYELYPRKEFNSTFWQRQTWFGDFSINCPTYYIAFSLSNFSTPVYKLIFNAGSQLHGAIGPYLGDILYGTRPGENGTLANVMRDWYVSFALHANPNVESWSDVVKPHWPLYEEGGEIMSVNYTELGVLDDSYYDESDRCDFFWNNEEVVQN